MLVYAGAVAAVVAQSGGLVAALAFLAVAGMLGACAGAWPRPRPGCSRRLPAACALIVAVACVAAREPPLPDGPTGVLALLGDQGRSAGKVRLRGEVAEVGGRRGPSVRLIVDTSGALQLEPPVALSGAVRLSIAHSRRRWQIGERLAFSTTLRRITNFGNPGEFDFAGWNARRGIFVSAFVWDDDEIEMLADGREPGWALRARRAVRRAARRPGGRGASLVAALITGDRSGLDEATLAAVRAAGLSHVLAISGLHTGIVFGCVLWAGRRLLPRTPAARAGYDTMRAAASVAACFLSLYLVLSGGGVAVSRAAIMAFIFLALLWRGRTSDGLRALAWAALALTLALPGVAREAGFQLSFAAVGAILLTLPKLAAASRERGGGQRAVAGAVTLSLVCWWVTTPIVAHHFHRISIPAPAVNVMATPLVAVVVVLGLAAAALLAVAPAIAALGFEVAARVATLVLVVAERAARLPGAGLAVVDPGWPLALSLAALPPLLALARRWRSRAVALALAVSLALAGTAAFARYRTDRMDVYFVAVGQGDSTVVRLPGGEVMVVDGGPPGRGRSVLGPLLRRLRIGRIDYLVVTHAQSDHWGGLEDLVAEFAVGELWHAGGSCASVGYRRFRERLAAAGTRVVVQTRGPALASGRGARAPEQVEARRGRQGWLIETLWPALAVGDCADNDRSLVLAVEFAGVRVLLAGDIERRGEAGLLASGVDLGCDVLKVPHHGSRTSSSQAFLAAVEPGLAVASVGLANRYGFPHEEVLHRYASLGTRLFRTDLDGGVHVAIDGGGARATVAKLR